MRFDLRCIRFTLAAGRKLTFGRTAANALRGAIGTELAHAVAPEVYQRFFRPQVEANMPGGYAQPPLPFVLRTRHLNQQFFEAETVFTVNVHAFDISYELLDALTHTFERFAHSGITHQRIPVRLLNTVSELIQLPLDPTSQPIQAVRVSLLTPTELKGEPNWKAYPDFPTLAARLRDRISLLRTLYGPGPLNLDFRDFVERARNIEVSRFSLHPVTAVRRSTRTGQVHSLGGVIGEIDYAGALTEFLPFLEAARWIGVGRHTVWGQGELEAKPLSIDG